MRFWPAAGSRTSLFAPSPPATCSRTRTGSAPGPGRNNACIAGAHGMFDAAEGQLAALAPNVAAAIPAYVLAAVTDVMPEPAGILNRFIALRVAQPDLAVSLAGVPDAQTRNTNFWNNIFRAGAACYELRIHASAFLQTVAVMLQRNLNAHQTVLDGVRATLRGTLGFTDDRIIDVPVIFGAKPGSGTAFPLSGDNVNPFQIKNGDSGRCLAAKPFGSYSGRMCSRHTS